MLRGTLAAKNRVRTFKYEAFKITISDRHERFTIGGIEDVHVGMK